jgi:hypothetical protein
MSRPLNSFIARCAATTLITAALLTAVPVMASPNASAGTGSSAWLPTSVGVWFETVAGPWVRNHLGLSPSLQTDSHSYRTTTAADEGEIETPPGPGTGGQLPCWGLCTAGGPSSDPDG